MKGKANRKTWVYTSLVECIHHGDGKACIACLEADLAGALLEVDALRSRVEALEGALNRADLFFELTCNTLEEMLGDDVPEDRQREVCAGMIAAIQDYDLARAALQPDKGERGGDWPEDFSHENGEYQCRCVECGSVFIGHKRRVVCRTCADKGERSETATADFCGPDCGHDHRVRCGGKLPACPGCPDCSEAP